jgi:tripartite-type tricarboxylate transporter receptor subunit TctC
VQIVLRRSKAGAVWLGLWVAVLWSSAGAAQPYPARPVTVLIGNAAGSASDILARTVAEELKATFKQGFVMINRPGANGSIVVEQFRHARPDGYTLMFASMTMAVVNPHVQADAKYNSADDFEPIARLVQQPLLWAVGKGSPLHSLKDVVTFARSNPDLVRVARLGYGGSTHLVSTALMAKQNLKFSIIGFGNASEVYTALRRNDIEVLVDLPQPLLPRIRTGDLIPLAVTSATRIKALPEVATWRELGLMDAPITAWYAFMAPKGTAKEIVDQLNVEMNRVLNSPRIRQQFEEVGGIVQTLSPDELRRFMREEHLRWGQIIKSADLRPE